MITSLKVNTELFVGGVAEWLNAPVLKTDVGESLPWVRIPPPPPFTLIAIYTWQNPYLIDIFSIGTQNGTQNGTQKFLY